ncbi:hypothetical protein [Algoriphagus sp. PAP.12]|uniref:hypothetical protein n=1 Tax=Algoriphagus sp. PAP.12 TaxID=2996678 RepID=UPI00227CC48D|nr:hypothetical protein [Algoriphagus sp. PAP.12]
MDFEQTRKAYRSQEMLVLILMVISLPLFGFVYLYYNSGNLDWNLPKLPDLIHGLLVGIGVGLLIGQYLIFHNKLKVAKSAEELFLKLDVYIKATRKRFLILFAISLISTIGLLFFKSAFYIVIFAVTLLFYSLAKPTPDRIKRLLKLNKEDAEIVKDIARPS